MMEIWKNMTAAWASVEPLDIFFILYIMCLMTFVAGSNQIFADFVASKPEGRKTAAGEAKEKLDRFT